MKRTLFVLTTILFFALALTSCKKDEANNNSNNNDGGGYAAGYVDLGLPSGTKWKSTNEIGGNNGFYTYDEAISAFGDKLPTKEQFDELRVYCSWEWQNNGGYKVTGTNGNSIVLPAAGCRSFYGDVISVGYYGYYWSSTPFNSEYAWFLRFNYDEVDMNNGSSGGFSVRLVQK